MAEQFSPLGDVLVCAQNSTAKTAALHLAELVNQHVASGADVSGEAATTAQHQGLAEGAAVSEFGEMQFNGLNVLQCLLHRVCVIGQCQQMVVRQGRVFCVWNQLHIQLSVDGAQGFVVREVTGGIGSNFEGLDTDAIGRINKTFAMVTLLCVHLQHCLNHIHHFSR